MLGCHSRGRQRGAAQGPKFGTGPRQMPSKPACARILGSWLVFGTECGSQSLRRCAAAAPSIAEQQQQQQQQQQPAQEPETLAPDPQPTPAPPPVPAQCKEDTSNATGNLEFVGAVTPKPDTSASSTPAKHDGCGSGDSQSQPAASGAKGQRGSSAKGPVCGSCGNLALGGMVAFAAVLVLKSAR